MAGNLITNEYNGYSVLLSGVKLETQFCCLG